MEVNKNNITQFLTATNTSFIIPVFQRNYDWGEDNCKQLWNDIVYVAQGDMDRRHFLGTICSKSINGHEKSIIDGQQRITTITLLMKAMHDYVSNEDFKKDIESTFLRNTGYGVSESHKVKLHLNKRDDSVYMKLLENKSHTNLERLKPSEVNSNIYRNYEFFYKKLEGMSESQVASIRGALDRIVIVDLDVEGEDPQEIFESLNSTGLDLTPVDLLRNYLLMSLDYENQLRLYDNYWYKIEGNVKPDNMVRFFIDYLIFVKKSDAVSIRGRRAHVNERNLYIAFRNYYQMLSGTSERYSNSPEVTESVLKDMLQYSELYRSLVFDDGIDMNSLNAMQKLIYSLVYLNEAKASRPVLLYVLRLRELGEINEDQAMEMLQACLSLVFRAKVTRSTGINGQFAGNILQRLPEHATPDIIDIFWSELASGSGKFAFPSDEDFREALISRPIFDVIRSKGTKYLLYSLEQNSISSKGLPRYDDSNITVEHIMPVTLNENWINDLGKEASFHDDNLNKLGNLALTTYNSEMSNKRYDEKREWYLNSAFALTRKISETQRWGIGEIADRSKEIAEKCLDLWSFPEAYQRNVSGEPSVGKRRPPFRFSMIGLMEGDEVAFVGNPDIRASVLDDSHVLYDGKRYSLSSLAAELYGGNSALQGPAYFMFDGETLDQLRNEAEANVF